MTIRKGLMEYASLFRGTIPIEKVYRGNVLVFDRTEIEDPEPDPFTHNVNMTGLLFFYDFSTKTNSSEGKEIAENLVGTNYNGNLLGFGFTANSGYTSSGLRLDGVDDRISIPHSSDFNTTDWTVEMVCSINSLNEPSVWFFHKSDSHLSIFINSSATELRVYHETSPYSLIRSAVTLNQLTHWAIRRIGSTISLFRNNVLIGSRQADANVYNTGAIRIGPGLGGYFNSVRFYSRGLSDAELTSNYNDELTRYNIGSTVT